MTWMPSETLTMPVMKRADSASSGPAVSTESPSTASVPAGCHADQAVDQAGGGGCRRRGLAAGGGTGGGGGGRYRKYHHHVNHRHSKTGLSEWTY